MNTAILEEERQQLVDSVRRYVERGYGDAMRRASESHPDGCDPERWREFADLGWLALPLSEDDGGLGGSLADTCGVAEELGRGCVVEPYGACAVSAAQLLADTASPALRARWLPGLADGSLRLAFAPWEPGCGFDPCIVDARANEAAAGFTIQGRKSMVPGGCGVDAYLLSARVDDGMMAGLFLVDAQATGLQATARTLYDGRRAVELYLQDTPALALVATAPVIELNRWLRRAQDRAALVHCAETIGTMQRAFELTLDYLRTRIQFGRPIATNQVVQHRLVNLYVEIEEARALTRAAADAQSRPADATRYSAAAKARVSRAAKLVWEESVQLHGAIGMTDECALAPFVKRLAVSTTLYGSTDHQLERLAVLSLGAAAETA